MAKNLLRDGEGTRRRILRSLLEEPGLNKSNLCRGLGLAWGTVGYHLRVLRQRGLVHLETEGREVRVFPAGLERRHRGWLATLRDQDSARVLARLLSMPFQGTTDLGRELGLSDKVVRKHLTRLSDEGLVERQGAHRPLYFPAHEVEAVLRLAEQLRQSLPPPGPPPEGRAP